MPAFDDDNGPLNVDKLRRAEHEWQRAGGCLWMRIEHEDPSVLGAIEEKGSAEHRHVLHGFVLGRRREHVAKGREKLPGLVEDVEDLAAVERVNRQQVEKASEA
jgi:hypothetical protein